MTVMEPIMYADINMSFFNIQSDTNGDWRYRKHYRCFV